MAPRSRTPRHLPLDGEVVDLTSDTDEDINRPADKKDDGVINVIAGNPITEYHVGILLNGHEWLNDEIINSYLYVLHAEYTDVAVLSTYFHPTLCKEGSLTDSLKRWLKPVSPISDMRLVLIPINLGNTHWALVAYHVKSKTICYYDSMMHKKTGMSILQKYIPVFQYLEGLKEDVEVQGEAKEDDLADLLCKLDLGKPIEPEDSGTPKKHEAPAATQKKKEITLLIPEGQPRQQDGSSCGVFVCKWSQFLATRTDDSIESIKANFTQKDVTKHRREIIDILRNFKPS